MTHVKCIVLDVLKPHHPNVLDFAKTIAERGKGYTVRLKVLEMDDKTETLELIIEADDIDLEIVTATIAEMGGSLHSIDGVEVVGDAPSTD